MAHQLTKKCILFLFSYRLYLTFKKTKVNMYPCNVNVSANFLNSICLKKKNMFMYIYEINTISVINNAALSYFFP